MKYVKGDLLEAFAAGDVQAIAHQANCFNTMGGGIAKKLREYYPEAAARDNETKRGDRDKLGSLTFVYTRHGLLFNLYGQYNYGGLGRNTDYVALTSSLENMALQLRSLKFSGVVGLPKIGAGLGGGDWALIEQIIQSTLKDWDVVIYSL
jgi:O-acetyl-ADP-ribose deacetylase (regulator of RNase III)